MQPTGPKRPPSPPMYAVGRTDQSTSIGRVDSVKPGAGPAHSYTTQMAPSGRGAPPTVVQQFHPPIVDASKFPPPGSPSGSLGAGRGVTPLFPT